jgi:hypothetical protein
MAGAMWFYVNHVLIPRQRADAARTGKPRGNLSDLYPRWLGSRELLLHGRNPYGPEVTAEIQEGYYGRRLDPSRPGEPKDLQAFAYPTYVAFLLAPTVKSPFASVQRLFLWLLPALTIASMFCWFHVLRWRPRWAVTLTLLILTLNSFQVIQGVKLQQLSLVVAALIAAVAALLVRGHLLSAGIVLAVATIKPQLAAPMTLFLLFWTLAAWRERQRFFWGFATTLAILIAGAQWLLPSWIPDFWHAMAAYRRYTGGQSMLDIMAGPLVGKVLVVVILIAVIAVSWRFRRTPADSREFTLALAFALAATPAVIPMFAIYNQLLLLPAILILLREWDAESTSRGLTRMAGVATFVFLIWPWAVAAGLTVASTFLPAERVQDAWAVPLWTMLAIPVSGLVLLVPWIRDAYAQPAQDRPATGGVLALHDRTR